MEQTDRRTDNLEHLWRKVKKKTNQKTNKRLHISLCGRIIVSMSIEVCMCMWCGVDGGCARCVYVRVYIYIYIYIYINIYVCVCVCVCVCEGDIVVRVHL
jgi:hypothetical protein